MLRLGALAFATWLDLSGTDLLRATFALRNILFIGSRLLPPRVFHVTQCLACQGGLDLPAVHFMCNHSYHQRCLPQNETECPNCAREYGIIREIRRNSEHLADQCARGLCPLHRPTASSTKRSVPLITGQLFRRWFFCMQAKEYQFSFNINRCYRYDYPP
ncbi:hypothetical protein GY45DRAFT_165193 [Cubamyces sp. BRFM 1775]|nr:hypothetical protein GY45DRAFT_165193 [Cubamyces sp. BRFM 1775]